MNESFLPILNNTKKENDESKQEEQKPEPAATKPASPPWKITQPHNVTPIGKQLKELSEQKQQQQQQQQQHNHQHYPQQQNHFTGGHELWNRRAEDMTRYRYGDHEKRYRSDEMPRQELFNETNGQIEVVRRNWRGGEDRFDRRDPYPRNMQRDHFSRDMSRDRFQSRDMSSDRFQSRDLSRDRQNAPPPQPPQAGAREPVKPAKSIQEEQGEVMRLAREKARQRKEEELRKEQEHLEAARRKADELMKKLEEKRQQQAKEQAPVAPVAPAANSTPQATTQNTQSSHATSDLSLSSGPVPSNKPAPEPHAEFKPSSIMKPQRDNRPFADDNNNPAFRAATSVIGDGAEIKRDLRVPGREKLWTGAGGGAAAPGLWNSAPPPPPQQQRGDVWGPISSAVYNKPASTSQANSPTSKFKQDANRPKDLNGSPLSPNNGHSMFHGQWSTLPGSTTLQSTTTPASPVISQTQESTPSRLSESPNVNRGTSRFFPTPSEPLKEPAASPSNANGINVVPFDVYKAMVTSSSSMSPDLGIESSLGDFGAAPRVILPPRNKKTNGGSESMGSPTGSNEGFKVPSLNAIQALQSTIVEKLGTKSLKNGDLPIPESPIVASSIPIEGGAAFFISQPARSTKGTTTAATAPAAAPAPKPQESTADLAKRKPTSFAEAVKSGLPVTANTHAPPQSHTESLFDAAMYLEDLPVLPAPTATQAESSQLEEFVSDFFSLSKVQPPHVRIASANDLDYDLDDDAAAALSDNWASGLIPTATTFPESSFYYETPTSSAFLREFKPRKDILVAILIPGGKKINTGYRHTTGGGGHDGGSGSGSGNASKRDAGVSSIRGRRKKSTRRPIGDKKHATAPATRQDE